MSKAIGCFVWRDIVEQFFEVNNNNNSHSASLTIYWILFVLSVGLIMDGLIKGYRTPKRSASGPSLSPFSTSPNQLHEVTSSANATLFDQTKISPMRGRSVKEYDEQLTALKKENFNLKLRIYFLEERMGSTFRIEDKENIIRKNIEYQVDIETLRKELDEKQDLLCQAVKALELEDSEHKRLIVSRDLQIAEFSERIHCLEQELKSVLESNADLASRNEKLLDDSTQMYNEAFGLQVDSTHVKEEISRLQKHMTELESQNSVEESDGNKTVEDVSKCDMTTLEWAKQVEDLMEVIQEKEEEIELYKEKYDNTTSVLEQRDNRITELEIEVSDLKSELNTTNKKLEELRTEKSDNNKDKPVSWIRETEEKDKTIEQLESEVRKKTFNLQTIVNNELWDRNREIEKLQNKFTETIKLKDGEISELEKQVTSKDMELKMMKDYISDLGIQIILPPSLLTPKINLSETNVKTPEKLSVMKEQLKVSNEECKYLHKTVEELRQQLRNTPERDSDNKFIQLKNEHFKLQHELEKCEKTRQETVNLCSLLTTRLEELAYFLDSLLKHKSVLGLLGSKQRSAIKQAIDQSLNLSQSLSMSIMNEDQSLAQLSSITGLLNTTQASVNVSLLEIWREDDNNTSLTYNSHLTRQRGDGSHNDLVTEQAEIISILRAQIETMKKEIELRDMEICKQNLDQAVSSDHQEKSLKNDIDLVEVLMDLENKTTPNIPRSDLISPGKIYQSLIANKSCPSLLKSNSIDNQSESEAWSEPDRCVSQARIGLDVEALKSTSSSSNLNRSRSNRSGSVADEATSESTEEEIAPIKTPSKRGSAGSIETRHTITLLQDNLTSLETKLKEKENEILTLQKSILELDNKSLEMKLNMSEDIAKLRNEKIDVEKLLKESEEKFKNIDISHEEMIAKLEEMQDERDTALNNYEQSTAQIEILQIKTKELESLLKESQQEYQIKVKETNENWKLLVQQIEQEAESKLKAIQSATRDLKHQYESEWIQKSQMVKQVEEMEHIYTELDSIKELLKSSESKITSMEKSEQELKKRLTESEDSYREKIIALKRELNESTLRASQAALERTKVNNEKLKLEAEIRKIESRESERSNALEEKDKELINMKNNLQRQLAQSEHKKSCLQLKLSELETANADLHNRLVILQTSKNVWGQNTSMTGSPPKISELVTNFKSFGKHSLPRSNFMRQRSDMSGYASEDILTDENETVFNRSAPEAFHWLNQANNMNLHPVDAPDARTVTNFSPDLGIESDQGRFSSLETNATTATRPLLQNLELTASMNNLLSGEQLDNVGHYCNITAHKQLEKENFNLKCTVSKLESGLEKTMSELSKINKNKIQVEKAVCKQIHKTSKVLRQARANLDSGSENEAKRK